MISKTSSSANGFLVALIREQQVKMFDGAGWATTTPLAELFSMGQEMVDFQLVTLVTRREKVSEMMRASVGSRNPVPYETTGANTGLPEMGSMRWQVVVVAATATVAAAVAVGGGVVLLTAVTVAAPTDEPVTDSAGDTALLMVVVTASVARGVLLLLPAFVM